MDGWIKLHRKIIESTIWDKPPLYLKVWTFLLLSAQHAPYKGLKPGQVSLSIPDIIEGCKWHVGARVERPTKDQVFQIISFLRKPDGGGSEGNTGATMITTTKATHGMLIDIVNYTVYQSSYDDESNDESNSENGAKPIRKQRQPNNINKNVKNDKNEKNEKIKPMCDDPADQHDITQQEPDGYTPEFESFWRIYPDKRKRDKAKSFIAWKKAIKTFDKNLLIKCTALYAKDVNAIGLHGEFAKMPTTYLNGQTYKDYDRRDPVESRQSESLTGGQADSNQHYADGSGTAASDGKQISDRTDDPGPGTDLQGRGHYETYSDNDLFVRR